jgi:hypothetical protein
LVSGKRIGGVVAVAAVLAVGGPLTVRALAGSHGARASSMNAPAAAHPAASVQVFGEPRLAAAPKSASMPRTRGSVLPGHTHAPKPAAPPNPAVTTVSPGQLPSTPPGQPTPAAPVASSPAAGPAGCVHPRYQTSDPNGMWNLSPYFVANDAWGISGYNVSQTLYACSYSDWYVVATMDNSKGDGAVKTYPNSHRDFDSAPQLNSLGSITSTFAETSPGTGIYEDAYDIWLNGIASSTSTEVMIWTVNHGQTPSGSYQGSATIDGRSYGVYKTTGNYIAFVAAANFTSGTMNLKDFFQWLMAKKWIGQNSTLGQVDYGPELVSTNGVPATFTVSNFSVDAS